MTLTVNIKFKSDLTLPQVFAICQKAVNTPEGVEPLTTWQGLDNPMGIGADCAMGVDQEGGVYDVSLDIPYIASHEMFPIAKRVLDSLNVSQFSAHNTWEDRWEDNLDFLQ